MKYSRSNKLAINWKASFFMLSVFLMLSILNAQDKGRRPNFIQILTEMNGF
ncbi:hypothetical protein [Flavobacterium sp. JAS]|uniref:hypothetical protein n=1 Tax=Flavobacterium sp. JAS TaxID=2897329 RepID=UPI001E2CD762|nr:hypothetical protein [Flavobacterium sp. JAS]MCD0472364.1 hypothetical protein [Flavobacterium sp. JAS]